MPETTFTPVETAGNSPGAILKRCREYHDITLEEAADATKIGVSYLRALEGDQIREFANLAYLKGFLRIYAGYLGLNPDDMTRMYDKLYGVTEERGSTASAQGTPPARRRLPLQKLAMPLILLVLVLVTSLFIRRTPPRPAAPPPQPQQAALAGTPAQAPAIQPQHSSLPARKTATEPAKPSQEPPPSQTAAEPAAGGKRSGEPAKTGFILKLRVTQNGTLSASIDDSPAQPYELTIGDSIEWKAERHISLDLSNAGGVEAELNGRPLKALGATGKSAVITLDAEGVRP